MFPPGVGFDDMYSVPRGVEGVEVDSLTPRGSRGFGDVTRDGKITQLAAGAAEANNDGEGVASGP